MKKITVIICLIITQTVCSQTALYDISITTLWNAEQHTTLPDGAHWSPLAGATHNVPNGIIDFEATAPLTNGIKDIAEFGGTINFRNEIDAKISAGTAHQYLQQGFMPFAGNGSTATLTNVSVNENFPLITLVSMVAPSPDWFIAVNSVNLRSANPNTNNGWKSTFSMDVFAYDAGTDSGTDYTSDDLVTSPRVPIALISEAPIMGHKMATITFTFKSSTLSTNTQTQAMDMYLSPNPANDNITFSNLAQMNVKHIDIFSVLGKLYKTVATTGTKNTLRMDISDFNSGVYIVRLTDGSGNTTKRKLIVN